MGSHGEVVPGRTTDARPQGPRVRGGLVETLVVVTVLGVLSALVVAGVIGMRERVWRIACNAEVASVATAVDAYYARHRDYPPDAQALYDEGYLAEGSTDGPLVRYQRAATGEGYRVVGLTSSGKPCRTATRG